MSDDRELMDVKLDSSEWHGQSWEGVWVRHLEGDLYRIDNIPFYAYGVNAEDEVSAVRTSVGRLEFQGVFRRGGHSTYRLLLSPDNSSPETIASIETRIKRFGCSYEGVDAQLFAIDVPPRVDPAPLYQWLKEGEARGEWTFEEGHYEPPATTIPPTSGGS